MMNLGRDHLFLLDAQGRLDVDFKVPQADPKDYWDYSYRLEAEVTDAARRSMSILSEGWLW